MSKLPHNSLWARATTASTSSRASSVLTKSHLHYHSSSSNNQRALSSSAATSSALISDAAAALVPGAVAAPFFGPQPAGFAEALDQSAAADNSTLALSGYSAMTAPYQTSFLLSAPILRSLPTNHATPRPHRPMHLWSHAQMNAETSLSSRLPANTKNGGSTKLLFDANNSNNNSGDSSSTSRVVQQEGLEDFISGLLAHLPEAGKNDSMNWLSEAATLQQQQSSSYFSGSVSDSSVCPPLKSVVTSPSALPPSRTPSPKQSSYHHNVNRDSIDFGQVREPPAKFATTTSAEWSLSSSATSGGSSSASSSSVQASSSAAASTSSFSSSPPPAPSRPQTVLNDHWAKAFNVPRSTKQNDFMFEHGAYGIPKRHPLSSIRSSRTGDAKDKGKQKQSADRSTPSPDDVPTTSKVQQAAGMLAAAADFLAGPQTGSSSLSSREHRPMKGEEALNMAFSGGSTAEGHEVERYSASGRRMNRSERATQDQSQQRSSDQQSQGSSSVNRVAIRGEDGRIIKDRLRSVQVGEDAYFLRPDSLGVADGVGGWTSRPGADPALFSRLLMHFCAVELSRYDNLSASDLAADNGNRLKAWAAVDPVEVMHRAWERCVRASRREGILGSSTALLALLRGDELRIANVGDCVLMIIRGGEMLFRSTEQQHSFNFPVQLGMMGDTAETMKKRTEAASKARAAGEGEVRSEHMEDYDDVEDLPTKNGAATASSSKPFEETIDGQARNASSSDLNDEEGPEWDEPRRDAGRWSIRVQADDIIVVGSDGLMDNLFDEDIIEEVVRFLPVQGQGGTSGGSEESSRSVDASSFSPQLVSEALCSRAKAVSEDSRAISSPFQQRAMEEGLHYVGGKHDDISVLVCLVGEREGVDGSGTINGSGDGNTPSSNKCLIH